MGTGRYRYYSAGLWSVLGFDSAMGGLLLWCLASAGSGQSQPPEPDDLRLFSWFLFTLFGFSGALMVATAACLLFGRGDVGVVLQRGVFWGLVLMTISSFVAAFMPWDGALSGFL